MEVLEFVGLELRVSKDVKPYDKNRACILKTFEILCIQVGRENVGANKRVFLESKVFYNFWPVRYSVRRGYLSAFLALLTATDIISERGKVSFPKNTIKTTNSNHPSSSPIFTRLVIPMRRSRVRSVRF